MDAFKGLFRGHLEANNECVEAIRRRLPHDHDDCMGKGGHGKGSHGQGMPFPWSKGGFGKITMPHWLQDNAPRQRRNPDSN